MPPMPSVVTGCVVTGEVFTGEVVEGWVVVLPVTCATPLCTYRPVSGWLPLPRSGSTFSAASGSESSGSTATARAPWPRSSLPSASPSASVRSPAPRRAVLTAGVASTVWPALTGPLSRYQVVPSVANTDSTLPSA